MTEILKNLKGPKKKHLTYRALVRPEDLNPAHRLFGGRLSEWCDSAAALYVMCQLGTKNIVTLKISEMLFKKPVFNGDFLEFFAETYEVGTTSFSVKLTVVKKDITNRSTETVLECVFVFVAVNDDGLPIPHNFKEDYNESMQDTR
jgi:acyl-CoA thioesterase YciA